MTDRDVHLGHPYSPQGGGGVAPDPVYNNINHLAYIRPRRAGSGDEVAASDEADAKIDRRQTSMGICH